MVRNRWRESYRIIPLRPGGNPPNEGAAATGGASSTMARFPLMRPGPFRRLHRHETCDYRTDQSISLDGRAHDIACGQIDIGNAGMEMTGTPQGGALQANGDIVVEPRIDARHVADAVVYMASLPLNANVQFITVMATRCLLSGGIEAGLPNLIARGPGDRFRCSRGHMLHFVRAYLSFPYSPRSLARAEAAAPIAGARGL